MQILCILFGFQKNTSVVGGCVFIIRTLFSGVLFLHESPSQGWVAGGGEAKKLSEMDRTFFHVAFTGLA